MKIDVIIPTIYRSTLDRAIKSIETEVPYRKEVDGTDINLNILVEGDIKDGRGVGNRNSGLSKVKDSDWIVFLDDDDWMMKGFSVELDNEYDIVVLRMFSNYNNPYEPYKLTPPYWQKDNELEWLAGTNIAVKTSFYLKHNIKVKNVKSPDSIFFRELADHTSKIKITPGIYYMAPFGGYNKVIPNGKKT
jgi:glycosyltransferase involved in cell wall biosynthesis|tara:strand:- start:340 stop:909 length:570 start_codon:yes stop_codon:yes gene_type:complete